MTTLNTFNPPENEPSQVIERPDGFYWQDMLTKKLYGPFTTKFAALQDMDGQIEDGYEEGESVEEAEAEIGIANWIDPETGEPAEDFLPHLSEE
ncbi:MAG: hypothetical protein HY016_01340 [Nitrosomonadales bacterium]|nr:hypothetical protein [Nitrosomonadales bacterium]